MLEDAVFENKNKNSEINPCYITQMTKAYFKDGNVDHALSFFEKNLKKLREIKTAREDFLISHFDSIFGEEF